MSSCSPMLKTEIIYSDKFEVEYDPPFWVEYAEKRKLRLDFLKKRYRIITMGSGTEDSVIVYFNGKIIFNKTQEPFLYENDTSKSKGSENILVKVRKFGPNRIEIHLVKQKAKINFQYDTKFSSCDIHFGKTGVKNSWRISYTNYGYESE